MCIYVVFFIELAVSDMTNTLDSSKVNLLEEKLLYILVSFFGANTC